MPYTCKSPETEQEWADYFQLRWQILRAPWQQPPGSERDELEGTAYHIMVKSADASAIGTGRLHRINNHSAQIRYMAVAEELQGNGIGGLILGRLENKALDWDCQEIVLNARSSCLGFYTKHAYEIIGEAPTLFGSIAHKRMRKRLV